MNEDLGKSKIGSVSLWTGILGFVGPILIAFLVHSFAKTNPAPYYLLSFLLFMGLELVALITGIIGRKSPCGLAGMIISIVCTALTVLTMLLAVPFFWLTARAVAAPRPVLLEPARTMPAPEQPTPRPVPAPAQPSP